MRHLVVAGLGLSCVLAGVARCQEPRPDAPALHDFSLAIRPRETVAIGGPLCTPQDQFADAVALPPFTPGDAVAVLAAGAYGLTCSPVGFLSHATPAEVLVDRGEARVVRARGSDLDALRGQSV